MEQFVGFNISVCKD